MNACDGTHNIYLYGNVKRKYLFGAREWQGKEGHTRISSFCVSRGFCVRLFVCVSLLRLLYQQQYTKQTHIHIAHTSTKSKTWRSGGPSQRTTFSSHFPVLFFLHASLLVCAVAGRSRDRVCVQEAACAARPPCEYGVHMCTDECCALYAQHKSGPCAARCDAIANGWLVCVRSERK